MWGDKIDGIVKCPEAVTPAKAGVHNQLKLMDPRLRGDEEKNTSATNYERIKIDRARHYPLSLNR